MSSASENKRSIIVGIFVLVGIAILIAGIFILGGQQNHFAKTVTVTTTFPNVSGLKAGNNVWFSGVKVGTVKSIEFKGLDQVEVKLNIDDQLKAFIRKDALASIGSDGFIGNKLILLEGGTMNAPVIENGDILVSKVGGGMDAMLETLQVNNQNIVGVTENLGLMLERINAGQGTVGTLLNDSLMATEVRAMMRNLNATAENTARATQALAELTGKLNTQGTLVNDLLSDTVIFKNLSVAVNELRGITETTGQLMTNMQHTTEKLNDKDNAIGLLLNDENTANTIQKTLDNLERSTEKLDQNMEALQHNFLFRGFFRKQEKQEKQAAKDTQP